MNNYILCFSQLSFVSFATLVVAILAIAILFAMYLAQKLSRNEQLLHECAKLKRSGKSALYIGVGK